MFFETCVTLILAGFSIKFSQTNRHLVPSPTMYINLDVQLVLVPGHQEDKHFFTSKKEDKNFVTKNDNFIKKCYFLKVFIKIDSFPK